MQLTRTGLQLEQQPGLGQLAREKTTAHSGHDRGQESENKLPEGVSEA